MKYTQVMVCIGFDIKKIALCILVPNWILQTVLDEVEKNSFIALPDKKGHYRLLPSRAMCPNPGGFDEEFLDRGAW